MKKTKIFFSPRLLFLLIYLVIAGYPFFWMVISSFKGNVEFFTNPWGIPENFSFINYLTAWNNGIQKYMMNSIFLAIIVVVVTLIIASMAGFILSRQTTKINLFLLNLFLIGIIVPLHSTLIPIFVLCKNMGILNTRASLIFPYIAFALPIAVFLFYGFFKQTPKSLEEAATIDGANLLTIFIQIFLPLSKSIMATVSILTAISVWNEFILALVLISKEAIKTLTIGLMTFQGSFVTDYAGLSAALVLASLPILIMYVVFQEQVTSGLTAGAVKE